MSRKLSWVGFGIASFWFYLRNAAPSVTAGDSGEFITTAATLSLAHAPSYPLFSLLGRVFLELVPFASVGTRMNMFSAFTSGLTLVCVAGIFSTLGWDRWKSFAGALLFGCTTSFWMNSLVTEVFPLNTLLAALLIWILLMIGKTEQRPPRQRWSLLFIFILGLGLGNHHTLIFFGPIFGFVLWRKQDLMWAIRKFGWLVCAGLVGFSVYAMLPIRSAKNPPLNWGQPTTAYRFYRTLARKDYGSFSLALGDTPVRSFSNTVKHLKNFSKQIFREVPWPIALILFIGLMFGYRENPLFFGSLLILFGIAGPGFYLLSNMPFTGQSEGIMGRFFILPMFALCFGLYPIANRLKRYSIPTVAGLVLILLLIGQKEAHAHRNFLLVRDYGQAMLRTLPKDGALFMDGGDDAFYSLAMLAYVENQRPDTMLHDRGGLIFENPYGPDFRRLSKMEKSSRRLQVESRVLTERPLFYSTMDPKVFPEARLDQIGFLVEVNSDSTRLSWPLITLRGLYPLATQDYRSRALGCFFPFMRGKQNIQQDRPGLGLAYMTRSHQMGYDIDWLKTNLAFDYSHLGYQYLNEGSFWLAERVYKNWISLKPKNEQPYMNLGVVYERTGNMDAAREIYEKGVTLFPKSSGPVYNLAVWHWRKENWTDVIQNLEKVLQIDPNHGSAKRYLEMAKTKI